MTKFYIYSKESNDFIKSEIINPIKWKSKKIPTRKYISKSKNKEWHEIESFFNIFTQSNTKQLNSDFILSQENEADFFLKDYIPQCLEYYLELIPGHKSIKFN